MIRTLLTTTALAAALTTGALAAGTMTKTEGGMGTTTAISTPAGTAVFTNSPDATPMDSINGYFAAAQGQILATTLIGKSLYNGIGEEAEAIGEVNDVVLSPSGDAEAIVVGVGGFLGIGEKDVAVDFERIGWTERDGERWLTISATQEELENAPAFDRSIFAVEDKTTELDINTENKEIKDLAAKSDVDPVMTQAGVASADELIGTPVYGAKDETVGEVGDVIVSADGMVEAVIIDVGGFLGIGAKPVSMDVTTLQFKKDNDGDLHVYTAYTADQLEALPEYSGTPKRS